MPSARPASHGRQASTRNSSLSRGRGASRSCAGPRMPEASRTLGSRRPPARRGPWTARRPRQLPAAAGATAPMDLTTVPAEGSSASCMMRKISWTLSSTSTPATRSSDAGRRGRSWVSHFAHLDSRCCVGVSASSGRTSVRAAWMICWTAPRGARAPECRRRPAARPGPRPWPATMKPSASLPTASPLVAAPLRHGSRRVQGDSPGGACRTIYVRSSGGRRSGCTRTAKRRKWTCTMSCEAEHRAISA